MRDSATFEDILNNGITALNMIQSLNLHSKRNLRLVSHASKDAVDKTVTSVWYPKNVDEHDYPLVNPDRSIKHLDKSNVCPALVESVMQASWVPVIEMLDLTGIKLTEKGARAIAEASFKAVNLKDLRMGECDITNEEAFILAQGSYPKLKRFDLGDNKLYSSGLIAIFEKCPSLEEFDLDTVIHPGAPLDDPEHAKIIAEKLSRQKGSLNFDWFYMTLRGAHALFKHCGFPLIQQLIMNEASMLKDDVIAGLVKHDWPDLKELQIGTAYLTDEGYRVFSSKEWPALTNLQLTDIHDDFELKLESKNLPVLEHLVFQGLDTHMFNAVKYIALQSWPHLRYFECTDNGDFQLEKYDVAFATFYMINFTQMPSLKNMVLSEWFTEDEWNVLEEKLEGAGISLDWG